MKDWQDVMIEQYGPDWAFKPYGIVEIGKLAEWVVELKAEIRALNKGNRTLRATYDLAISEGATMRMRLQELDGSKK